MVTTFEATAGGVRRLGEHPTMPAATADVPDGVYTTFRTYRGNRVLRLGQHLRRLEESATLAGVAGAALDDGAVRRALGAILGRAPEDERRFRLVYAPPRLFFLVEPFTPYPGSLYDDGVCCVTVPLRREIPHAKRTAFIAPAAAAYAALPAGVHEGLMVAEDGTVLEGLSSNFLAVAPPPHPPGATTSSPDLALRTEMARVLAGVTRSLVLEVAREVLPLSDAGVHRAELPAVGECFITSASREILPVVRIDQGVIGDGRPGPITRELMRRLRALIEREAVAVS